MNRTERQRLRDSGVADGDHDRFAQRRADIVRSNVEGVPVVALCGKRWIPNRDPDGYPVCPTCNELTARRGSPGSEG